MGDFVVRQRAPASFEGASRGRGIEEVTINILNIQVSSNIVEETNNNPLHVLVAFIFFGLVGFLQIRYPESPTPFEIHPKTAMISIASFLAYCLAFLGRLKFAVTVRFHRHFDTLMHVFASLSLISLVVLLLPDTCKPFGFIIMYTLWFITHVLAVINTFRNRFREIWLQLQPPQIRRVLRPLLPTTSMDMC